MDKIILLSLPFLSIILAGDGVWTVNSEIQLCGGRWPHLTHPRIEDGDVAGRNEFPWLVSLQIREGEVNTSEHFCGGALLNEEWVLTARQCFNVHRFESMSINPYKAVVVKAGEHKLRKTEYAEQERLVEETAYLLDQGIVLLKVNPPFRLQPRTVFPICLPPPGQEPPSPPGNCVLAGWGDTKVGPSNVPRSLKMPILSENECIKFGVHFKQSICAGYVFENQGAACWGDIGSPLACVGSGSQYYVWGVLTDLTSVTCLPPHTPVVFSGVSHIMNWINGTVATQEPTPTPTPTSTPTPSSDLPTPNSGLPTPTSTPTPSSDLPTPNSGLPTPTPYSGLPTPTPSSDLPTPNSGLPTPNSGLPTPTHTPNSGLPTPTPSSYFFTPSSGLPTPTPSSDLPTPTTSSDLPTATPTEKPGFFLCKNEALNTP